MSPGIDDHYMRTLNHPVRYLPLTVHPEQRTISELCACTHTGSVQGGLVACFSSFLTHVVVVCGQLSLRLLVFRLLGSNEVQLQSASLVTLTRTVCLESGF